jgi:RyR and IP3R Homology associated
VLKKDNCVSLLTTDSTPLLIRCYTLQTAARLHDLPIPAVITVMLMDMNAIQTQLNVRTPGHEIAISNCPLGIKLPKTLQIADSPYSSDKSGGNLDLAACKASCAEYLFQGVLGTLAHILFSCFPYVTPALIKSELSKLQQNSRSWCSFDRVRNVKNRTGSRSHTDQPMPDSDGATREKYGDHLSTTINPAGGRSLVELGIREEADLDSVTSKEENKAGHGRRGSSKGRSSVFTWETDGTRGDERARPGKLARGISSFATSFSTLKPAVDLDGEATMSMETKVQIAECVIILFDTLMCENALLFHTSSYSPTYIPSGDFNLLQCGRLLELCIGAHIMLSSQTQVFLVPERFDKVEEILKSLVSHLFELKLRYSILERGSECTKVLCKTALRTAVQAARRRTSSVADECAAPQHSGEPWSLQEGKDTVEVDKSYTGRDSKDLFEIENGPKSFFKRSSKMPTAATNNLRMFTDELELAPNISYERLQKSALFVVFKEMLLSATVYLESGGPVLVDIDGNAVKDMGARKDLGTVLSHLSAFDLWLCGGSRYLSIALGMLAQTAHCGHSNGPRHDLRPHTAHEHRHRESDGPVEVSSTLFHIFILLLRGNGTRDLERIQRSQNALHILGASTVVLRLLGRSHSMGKVAAITSPVPRLALKLGSSLASRNSATQNAVIDTYKISLHESLGQQAGSAAQMAASMKGIQRLLKLARAHTDLVRSQGPSYLNVSTLKILIQIFSFCGMLCSGHNSRARHFLRDQDYLVGLKGKHSGVDRGNYDIVRELALAVNSLLAAAASIIRYVNNAYFNEYVAPVIWAAIPSSGRRRFIAWHDNRVDYFCLAQLMHTAAAGFACLTELSQGPCVENQRGVLLAVTRCPSLLEFLGETCVHHVRHFYCMMSVALGLIQDLKMC